jgi:hypothetical protein
MDLWVWIVLAAIAVVIIIAIVGYMASKRRRSTELRESFGSEYDRTVGDADDVRSGEAELAARRDRREQLDIRPLAPAAADRYARSWETTQSRFVDDPNGALAEADMLVVSVMRDRGYPVDDFDQRAADVSVDHPEVVEHYRAAHTISARSGDVEVEVSTEDMRQGLVHYRALFEELLETSTQPRS